MSDSGYVKTFRQIKGWEFWDKPYHNVVWLHLLVEASWKEKTWKYGQELHRGELIITLRGFAEECGIKKDTLARVLKDFERAGQIKTDVRQNKTFIKVLNYAVYQGSGEAPRDSDETKVRQSSDTDATPMRQNEDTYPYILRKEKRKKERSVMANPTLDQIREYVYAENLMVDPEKFFDYYESQGWKLSNGNRMKDWKASCRNWHRKEVEKMNKEKKGVLPF